MNPVAIVCFALGTVVIVTRAPLIFAPHAKLDCYRRLVATDARVRLMGVVVGALGLAMAWAGQGSSVTGPAILLYLGFRVMG